MLKPKELLNKIHTDVVVLRNDQKTLKETFHEHKTTEEKWQLRIEKALSKCPEAEHIRSLQDYEKNQNGKIDRVSKCVTETRGMVETMHNKNTWKKELFKAACIVVPIIIAVLSLWFAVKTSHGGEVETKIECSDIDSVLKIFNDYPVTKKLGFEFKCSNSDSKYPTISVYTHKSHAELSKKKQIMELICLGISMDWFTFTRNRTVNIYNDYGLLVYIVDREGVFLEIKSMVTID